MEDRELTNVERELRGYLSAHLDRLPVRSAITEAPVLTINSALPQVAVSPNGHEIAYWRVLPNRQGQAASELIRSDLTDPASRDRVVMGTPSGEVPGQIIWSSDGTGL